MLSQPAAATPNPPLLLFYKVVNRTLQLRPGTVRRRRFHVSIKSIRNHTLQFEWVDKIHSAVPSALTACLSFNYRKTRAGCCFAMQVYGGRRSPKESEWMHIRSTLPSAAGKNINKQSTGSDLATQCNSSCKVDLFFFFSSFFGQTVITFWKHWDAGSTRHASLQRSVKKFRWTTWPLYSQFNWRGQQDVPNCSVSHFISFSLLLQ